jgi:hypothetical protein
VLKADAACVTGGNAKPDRMKNIAGTPKKGLKQPTESTAIRPF